MSEFIKITGTRVILILNKNMDQKCLKFQCLSSSYTELSKQEVGSWALQSLFSSTQLQEEFECSDPHFHCQPEQRFRLFDKYNKTNIILQSLLAFWR